MWVAAGHNIKCVCVWTLITGHDDYYSYNINLIVGEHSCIILQELPYWDGCYSGFVFVNKSMRGDIALQHSTCVPASPS